MPYFRGYRNKRKFKSRRKKKKLDLSGVKLKPKEPSSLYNPELTIFNRPENVDFIKVLREQGTSNFDPVAFYKESNREKNLIIQEENLTKKEKKKRKVSAAAQKIKKENIIRRERELQELEEDKINLYTKKIVGLST